MRTLLLDRDGVINVNQPHYVTSWAEFAFLPGALEALALLARHDWRAVVVTNQAVVNRGIMNGDELDKLHERMVEIIAEHGGQIVGVLVCPHRPDEGCACRKPAPGLLFAAAERFGFCLDQALLVGDDFTDLEAARRAGCRSILVLSGRVREWTASGLPEGCVGVSPDLLAAARQIVAGKELGDRPAGLVAAGAGGVAPSIVGAVARSLLPQGLVRVTPDRGS